MKTNRTDYEVMAAELLMTMHTLYGQATLVASLESCGEREVLEALAAQARAAMLKATGSEPC